MFGRAVAWGCLAVVPIVICTVHLWTKICIYMRHLEFRVLSQILDIACYTDRLSQAQKQDHFRVSNLYNGQHAVVQFVEALSYKPEGRGYGSRWCHWNFSLTWSIRPHYGLGSTQPLTEMSKSSPVTGLEWPRGFQEVKVPRFHDNGTEWW